MASLEKVNRSKVLLDVILSWVLPEIIERGQNGHISSSAFNDGLDCNVLVFWRWNVDSKSVSLVWVA